MSSSNRSRVSRRLTNILNRRAANINTAPHNSHSTRQQREARDILIDHTRLSAHVLSKVPRGLHHWVQHQNFHDVRNKDECLALAQIIDCLVRDREVNIHTSLALEQAVRRLLGVHTADRTGKQQTCEALQLSDTSTTLIPSLIFDRVIRRAAQLESFVNHEYEDHDQCIDNNNYDNTTNNQQSLIEHGHDDIIHDDYESQDAENNSD